MWRYLGGFRQNAGGSRWLVGSGWVSSTLPSQFDATAVTKRSTGARRAGEGYSDRPASGCISAPRYGDYVYVLYWRPVPADRQNADLRVRDVPIVLVPTRFWRLDVPYSLSLLLGRHFPVMPKSFPVKFLQGKVAEACGYCVGCRFLWSFRGCFTKRSLYFSLLAGNSGVGISRSNRYGGGRASSDKATKPEDLRARDVNQRTVRIAMEFISAAPRHMRQTSRYQFERGFAFGKISRAWQNSGMAARLAVDGRSLESTPPIRSQGPRTTQRITPARRRLPRFRPWLGPRPAPPLGPSSWRESAPPSRRDRLGPIPSTATNTLSYRSRTKSGA